MAGPTARDLQSVTIVTAYVWCWYRICRPTLVTICWAQSRIPVPEQTENKTKGHTSDVISWITGKHTYRKGLYRGVAKGSDPPGVREYI